MKATVQKFKITEEQEILYGKLLKASAIAMGQQPKLPQLNTYQAQNATFVSTRQQAYDIIKEHGSLTSIELQKIMGFKSNEVARNLIHKLIRSDRVKKLPNPHRNRYISYAVIE
jgi:predicted HTH transcriptional regulator